MGDFEYSSSMSDDNFNLPMDDFEFNLLMDATNLFEEDQSDSTTSLQVQSLDVSVVQLTDQSMPASTVPHMTQPQAQEMATQADVATRPIAIHRAVRTIRRPTRSDPVPHFPTLQGQKDKEGDFVTVSIKGMDADRNLCFIADDQEDDEKALRYNMKIERGRATTVEGHNISQYHDPKYTFVPCGTTLKKMCRQYPLHCCERV